MIKTKNAFTLAEVFYPAEQSRRITSRIIRAVAGVTSLPSRKTILNRFTRQSNSRAGFAIAHTAPYRKFGFTLAEVFHPAEQSRRTAFTLAEVLITLGIIGVVAALTIPTLTYSYKKSVLETRIAHFSSLWQQAYKMAEAENGPSENWDAIKALNDPDAMLESYNKYFDKYIKTVDIYKTPKGVAFALSNGSGFHLRKRNLKSTFNGCLYLTFCVDYKACKELQDDITPTQYSDGKKIFSFYENGVPPKHVGNNIFNTRESMIENCKTTHYACSTLIEHDGWKIKEGYPIKL